MKISITCERKGWILYRMAEELKERLTGHEVSINRRFTRADIRYYINYGYYTKKSDAIDVAWFTHYDPDVMAGQWEKAARELDHCVAQSEETKRVLLSQGVPEDKISVIVCGADDTLVPRVRIGIVGRTYPGGRKGERLVRMLAQDEEVTGIVSLVANRKGWGVPVNELLAPDFYRSIDFLLIPSSLEGGPIPFIEALACGKLSIAPPIGNVPQFDHLEYKTGDYDDLKRVIMDICTPIYDERARIAAQARPYDWAHWAREHEKLFTRLYGNR